MSTRQRKLHNLHLSLSPNLSRYLSTANQLMAVGRTCDAHTSICLKKEVVKFAVHNVFQKVIIQLTPEVLNCRRKSIISVTSPELYFTLHENHVQHPDSRPEQENHPPQTPEPLC